MAAYGALTSLIHIINQLQHHPSPPISLGKQQVQSLTQNVTFLQEFLQGYNSHFCYNEEANPLEMRIADAAYAAEDVIESYIVDNIQLQQINCIKFYQDLQQVIEEMDLLKKVAMEIITEKVGAQDNQLQRNVSLSVGSSRSSTSGHNNIDMVGFDGVLLEIMDKLTAGRLDRQVIPIVGMGGIGKTTLARNIYTQPLIKENFDICAWTTISQQYNTKEILCEVLSQANKESRERLRRMTSEDEVGLALHKYLSGRRFLIVMDDMWSVEAWDKIKHFFPNNNNRSRVVVTTRQSELGSRLDNKFCHQMKFLDDVSSWHLFSKTVFGEHCFPEELKEIGKDIAKNCLGLPLSIVVVGGILNKSEHTQECWESIKKNLNSVVNSENGEYCLKILKMSYNHLPAYLKPCFLYMGLFEEDHAIHVSTLVKLWVSEGFLKVVTGKNLETVAEDYLKELVDRNLILIHELGSTGNIKHCKIHDLLRDLSVRQAEKERFYHVIKDSPESFLSRTFNPSRISNFEAQKLEYWFHDQAIITQGIVNNIINQRRVVIPSSTSKQEVELLSHRSSQSKSHIRSFICDNGGVPPLGNLRLLRTLREKYAHPSYLISCVFELVNLRYLAVGTYPGFVFPSSVQLLWNLHTLIVDNGGEVNAPVQIWNMSQLRHVEFFNRGLYLPDPPSMSSSNCDDNIVVMEKLQTLTKVWNFKCSEEVVRRIPNVKKLRVIYREVDHGAGDYYCLSNFECLHKLDSLRFSVDASGSEAFLRKLTFPHWLKKLKLSGSNFVWEEMMGKIGLLLPLLQKLELRGGKFKTGTWETVEGQFPSLKFLVLRECGNFEWWVMESSHFRLLEEICFYGLNELKEIPSEVGEILTLKTFLLEDCSESAVLSAKRIVEEQEELQDEQLSFHVRALVQMKEAQALQSLETPNFQVQVTKMTTFWTRPCPSFPVSSWRPAANN